MKYILVLIFMVSFLFSKAVITEDVVFKSSKKITQITQIAQITQITQIIQTAKTYLGVKYRYGGVTRKGIDCSAFVQKVYKKHGKKLPRTSSQQASSGKHIDKKNLQKGDLLFFSAYKRNIGHVGIVINPSKKLMIHASSGAGKVTISSYDKTYYKSHYKGARRL